jgi:chromosome segregation ATPase
MKFAEKKQAYSSLQGQQFLDSDTELLQKMDPKSQALTLGILDKTRAQREILWHLLDVATVEEIKANRGAAKTDPEADKKAAYKVFAEKELLLIDLAAADQKTMSRIANEIDLKTPNKKAAALRALLEEYRLNLPKEAEATAEKMEEVATDPDKINELESENEELKEQLDEVQSENEDLQDEIANLQDDLDSEKKNPEAANPE